MYLRTQLLVPGNHNSSVVMIFSQLSGSLYPNLYIYRHHRSASQGLGPHYTIFCSCAQSDAVYTRNSFQCK